MVFWAWLLAIVAGFGIGWAARGERDERRVALAETLPKVEAEDALRVAWRIYPRDPRRLLDALGIAHSARIHTGRRK